jgi:hypothetical protein
MIDEALDDLIQRELDGATTAEESAMLQRKLAAEPEARAYYERLRNLASVLSSIPPAEAPTELRAMVRAALQSRAPGLPVGADRSHRPHRRVSPHLRWRDIAFAGGGALVAATLLVTLARLPQPAALDPDRLGGAMGAVAGWEAARTVDRQELDASWITGHASVRQHEDLVAVELELQPQGDVTLELRFDGERFTPVGFTAAPSAETNVIVQSDLLHIDHVGRGASRLILQAHAKRGSSNRIDLSVRGESGLVERSLVVRLAPGG